MVVIVVDDASVASVVAPAAAFALGRGKRRFEDRGVPRRD